jgi:hypothetical protein
MTHYFTFLRTAALRSEILFVVFVFQQFCQTL